MDALDLLVLGFVRGGLPPALVDEAIRLRERGVVRELGVSSHDRPWLATIAAAPWLSAVMTRYSAAHEGAAREVFPFCADKRVLSYTATRWGTLLDPARVPRGERVPSAADCYRFVLSHPRVDLCLAAPRDETELGAALEAGSRGRLADDEASWMRRVGAHVRADAARAPTASDTARRVGRALRSLLTRGVTEEVVSRLNR